MARRTVDGTGAGPMWRGLIAPSRRWWRSAIEARRDPVTRGWLVVTGGSAARLLIGLVASVAVARAIGPDGLGVYALLAALAGIVGAAGDFGLSEAGVRRIAPVWPEARPEAATRARAFFWLRLLAAVGFVGIALVGVWFGPFQVAADRRLVVLALMGVVATAGSGAVSAILQATGHFARLTLVMLTNAGLTALLAAALAWLGVLDLLSALVVLGIGTSMASFIVGRRLLPAGLDLAPPGRAALLREGRLLASFGLWVWIGNALAMLAARLDLFLAAHWLAPAVVGAYALAANLAAKADVVNQSLHAALLPTAARLDAPTAVGRYLRRGLGRSALIAAGLLMLVPIARPAILLLFGSAYAPAVSLFLALLGIAIFDVLVAPLLLLPYATDQPRLLAAADALRAAMLLLSAIWLVPAGGPFGLVAAKLLSHLAGALLTGMVLYRRAGMRRLRPAGESAVRG